MNVSVNFNKLSPVGKHFNRTNHQRVTLKQNTGKCKAEGTLCAHAVSGSSGFRAHCCWKVASERVCPPGPPATGTRSGGLLPCPSRHRPNQPTTTAGPTLKPARLPATARLDVAPSLRFSGAAAESVGPGVRRLRG